MAGPVPIPSTEKEVWEALGSVSPSQGARTTRISRSLTSGLRSWVPRYLAGTQVGRALALVAPQLLILVHVQHPHAKWLKYLVLPVCPSSPLHPYSPNPGLFHPNRGTLTVLQLLLALGLTGSAAGERWATLCFHRKAPRGDPHVPLSSVRDPRRHSFLPPR